MIHWVLLKYMETKFQKTNNLHYAKTKTQISCAVTAHLCFCSIDRLMSFLSKSTISSFSKLFLLMYSLVCVGPGMKPTLLVFSCKAELEHRNFLDKM